MSKILNSRIYIGIIYASFQGGAMEPVAYAYMIDGGSTGGGGNQRIKEVTDRYKKWDQIDDYVYAKTEADIWTYVEGKYNCPRCCGWF